MSVGAHQLGSQDVQVAPWFEKMWLACDGLSDGVTGMEKNDVGCFRGLLSAAIDSALAGAVTASEKGDAEPTQGGEGQVAKGGRDCHRHPRRRVSEEDGALFPVPSRGGEGNGRAIGQDGHRGLWKGDAARHRQKVRENREAKDGKWQKKLDGVEARLLGRVEDELGDTPATIASVRADVLQLTKQAADMPTAMEKAVMDEIFRSGTEQLEMGQAKLREEMARLQQETEEAMGDLTAKLNNVKENTDALGSGLLTVQNVVMICTGRRITGVLYKMDEGAEGSTRVWGEGPKLGPHFAHWKATKKKLKGDIGDDDDDEEKEAGCNLSGPPQQEAADNPSGPSQQEAGLLHRHLER
ncbi:unnamed protein product [Ectocarpus sp. CCAP 1310/34]|nr:unnamed protein product [Ectocarpus sp. CCAP 1310/34]